MSDIVETHSRESSYPFSLYAGNILSVNIWNMIICSVIMLVDYTPTSSWTNRPLLQATLVTCSPSVESRGRALVG
jgi:hypothetical protein